MTDTNGYVRWRDLDAHRETEAHARHQLEERMERKHDALGERVNSLESVIDQQRGAKALVYLLIGSNLLAAVAVFVGLLR